MKRKFLSLILCLCMIFSLFTGYQSVFASEERGEYIIYLDVQNVSPAYGEAFIKNDYAKAIDLADKALDVYEKELLELIPNMEVLSRLELLLPSICVKIVKSDVQTIKSLPYVKKVYENKVIHEADVVRSDLRAFRDRSLMTQSTMMTGSNELIGSDDAFLSKYDGRGRVLAIVDGNMDPTHAVFYLSRGVKPRLSKSDISAFIDSKKLSIYDKTANGTMYENVYRSEKVPYGWNYSRGNDNLNPENEVAAHGQHVSGTVAGNRYNIEGKTWRGVAPEAQLLMMNVMNNGSTNEYIYLKAMQDALVMGAEAVNMSLGATKGQPVDGDDAVTKAINNGYALDTNYVIAAGNEGGYKGFLNIENPDFGTMATPGTVTNAVTVASLENKTLYAYAIEYDGQKYFFDKSGDIFFEKGEYEFVDCGLGRNKEGINDFEGKNVNGKVALIQRGGLTFTEKIQNAEKAGAIGVIVYNNAEGMIGMSIDGTKIPAISVEQKTGLKMIEGKSKKVFIDMKLQQIHNPQYGELSTFTNWGLSSGGYMKPDITAPGGHIYSAQTGGNTFGDMSGTSMATPHVTGAIGVIRDRLDDRIFAGVVHKAALTKTILMKSAVPHMDPKTKTTTSPRRQGAGVMNLKKATELDFTAVDRDTKIASKFVGNVNDKITLNLLVHNYSNRTKTITPTVQATIEARDGKKLLLRPDELFSRTYEDKKFEVDANSEKEFNFTFDIENMDKVKDFTNGAFVEGFLHLKDQDGMEISFPFVSFKGSYETIPSIEKPLYDFDFVTERPMHWDIKPLKHNWYSYSTHIETKAGKYLDEKKVSRDKVVIAGLKNFDAINSYRKNPVGTEPKPEFEKIFISPNNDGYYDNLDLYVVMLRNAKLSAIIEDASGVKKTATLGFKYSSVSDTPDHDKNYDQYMGFTREENLDIWGLDDGEYTLRLKGEAVKDVSDYYAPSYREIKFTIDTTAPDFTDVKYNEAARTLAFKVVDKLAGLDEIKILNKDKEVKFTNNDGLITFTLPEGVNLGDVMVTATDKAKNTKSLSAERIALEDIFGSLKIETKGANYPPANLVYEVQDEAGNVYTDIENLKFGKYKLIIKSYAAAYKLKGEAVREFEINKENKVVTIDLSFDKVPTQKVNVDVSSMADLKIDDFDIFAKNLEDNKVTKLFKSSGYFSDEFSASLPYGKYEFYVEYNNGRTGYKAIFNDKFPYTIDKNSDYINLKLNIIKLGQYQIDVKTKGVDKEVKYLAKNERDGSVRDIESVVYGTWIVYPQSIPEGYYLSKPFEKVVLTREDTKKEISFEFKEKAGKEFTFNIKDNYDGAKYFLCDFYEWQEKGKGKVIEYTKNMKLDPGFYYVEAKADAERYGETKVKVDDKEVLDKARTFSSDGENVELEFTWTEFSKSKKTAKASFSINDSALDQKYKMNEYPIVFTGTHGEPIQDAFTKGWFGFNRLNLTLLYDKYTLSIKGLDSDYTIEPSVVLVTGETYEDIKIVPKKLVKTKVNFTKDGQAVDNVTFKLNNKVFTSGEISIAAGKYKVSIVNPKGLTVEDAASEVNIDETTSELTINLVEKVIDKGTITVKVVEKDGDKEKAVNNALVYIDDTKLDSYAKPVEVSLGEHTVKLSETKWNESDKYDVNKSVISKTVTLDKTKLDVEVKLVMTIKESVRVKPLKEKLKALLDDANNVREKDEYKLDRDEDKEAYEAAIAKATKVYEDAEATEKDVKDSIVDIKEAIKNLDGFKKANKEELKNLLAKYDEVINSKKYIYAKSEEKEDYQTAIVKANRAMGKERASQEEVDAAVKLLNEAYDKLSGVENPTEKTAPVELEEAYVNDRFIRGTGVVGATVFYEVISEVSTQSVDETKLRRGMQIGEDGKFSIETDQINKGDKIYVYQKEANKVISDPREVKVKPVDKSYLKQLLDKALEVEKSDKFNAASELKKEDLKKAIESAKEILDDADTSMEDIGNVQKSLSNALEAIDEEAALSIVVTFKPNNDYEDWTTKVLKNQKLTRPEDPKKLGHKFLGWFADKELTKEFDFDKAIEEETVLYAKWEELTYTVRFILNNGEDDLQTEVKYANTVEKPEDPHRKDFEFKGWYEDKELTKEFDFTKPIEANTDVYAKWEEILEYEITFDPNNGEATWTEKVREGKKVNKPADPIKANHTFIAWQLNGEDYNFNTSVMANMMLIAKWEENRVEPTPLPTPTPEPYEPYRPEPKPYRPIKPTPEPKPEEKKEETKPVETKPLETKPVEEKKDYGIITEYPTSPVETVVLKDVPKGPEGEAIRNLVSYGIIKGTGKGKFEGKKTINRAMVTRVFMLISKDKTAEDALNFTDVKDTAWYAESVKWAATKNIIAGYKDGTFKAEKKVTRQEFCVMLMNLLKVNGIELNTVVPVNEADFANVAAWAKDAMIAMKRAGLVNVDVSGKFGPESEFTRAELAKTINLLIKLIKLKEK